jgi:hypothetical protein
MSVPLKTSVQMLWILSEPLCGEIQVVGRLSRRERAREENRRKRGRSRTLPAGPIDGSGTPDGGSAITSDARSSGRTPYAGPAGGQGEEPKRALHPGGGAPEDPGTGSAAPSRALPPVKEMPGTPWALTAVVNEGAQIVPVIQELLKSDDDKVRLRILEVLLDAAYSKNSGREEAERPARMQWSIPRPDRD